MLAREAASFWREKVIAVVMLIRLSNVVVEELSYQMLEILERLRFTFTANGKRQTQVENFSEKKISR